MGRYQSVDQGDVFAASRLRSWLDHGGVGRGAGRQDAKEVPSKGPAAVEEMRAEPVEWPGLRGISPESATR